MLLLLFLFFTGLHYNSMFAVEMTQVGNFEVDSSHVRDGEAVFRGTSKKEIVFVRTSTLVQGNGTTSSLQKSTSQTLPWKFTPSWR